MPGLAAARTAERRARLTELAARLRRMALRRAEDGRMVVAAQAALLESFSHARVLARGFALVSDATGRPVTTREAAAAAGAVNLHFQDGSIAAQVAPTAPAAEDA
jgi:exodeoxyribonuclease VII large subunit